MQLFYFSGYLGSDAEAKYTPNGTMLCNFRVAITDSWVDANGEKHERTIWVSVTAWNKLAQVCADYLVKGSRVNVMGKVQEVRAYLTRNEEPGASLEVRADQVEFLTPRTDAEHRGPTQSDRPVGPNKPAAPKARPINDEDIPF